jgi:hypothetical protein
LTGEDDSTFKGELESIGKKVEHDLLDSFLVTHYFDVKDLCVELIMNGVAEL